MYYLLVVLFIILSVYLDTCSQELRAKRERAFSFLICVILVFLAAFRSDFVGADTVAYRDEYQNMNSYHSVQDIINRHTIDYLGYYLLSKLFHMCGMPVQVWFGFIEAIYLFALMKLVNRFSKDKVYSLLVFVTIGLFHFSMAGLKQTLAMSFMMLAFICFIEKKIVLFICLIVATYYTHQSALVFLGAFPLYYIRKTGWLIAASLLLCALIYSNSYLIMETMVDSLGNERWEQYLVTDSGYSSVTLVFYCIITLLAAGSIKGYYLAEPETAYYMLSMSILGCGLQLLASVSPSLFRLAYMYTPFMMILLPNSSFYSKNRIVVKGILIVCIVFYFLYTHRSDPYSFVSLFDSSLFVL